MEKKITTIKGGNNSYTAMILGRLQKDKRHTSVQFWGATKKSAINKLEKWIKDNKKFI